jgi:hypothetical protein
MPISIKPSFLQTASLQPSLAQSANNQFPVLFILIWDCLFPLVYRKMGIYPQDFCSFNPGFFSLPF